jgi:hypothetical protein
MAKGFNNRFGAARGQPRPTKIPAKARFTAFTIKYEGLVDKIVIPLGLTLPFDPNDYPLGNFPYSPINKFALWDTGASGSFLTAATVRELNLVPTGTRTINHAAKTGEINTFESNTYIVNLFLPNHVIIYGAIVCECEDIAGNVGAIIGMDVITRGDFSITNVDQKTWVSFRAPSMHPIDYVEQHNRLTKRK